METLVSLSKILDMAQDFVVTGDMLDKDIALYYRLENYKYRIKSKFPDKNIIRTEDYVGFLLNISDVYQDRSNGDLHAMIKCNGEYTYIVLDKKDILEMDIDFSNRTVLICSKGIKTNK